MRQPIFALFVTTALAACAGDADPVEDGEGEDEGDDGGEGSGGEEEAVRPEGCPAGELGAVAALTEVEAYDDPLEEAADGPRARYLWGGINDTTGFEIDLYDGYGAFATTPAAPGTFSITGDDADPDLCGLCLFIWVETEEWSYSFVADGGSVTLETVEGRLKGSASSLTFKEVGEEGGFLEGGCSAAIDSVPFDGAYAVEEEEPPA